MSSVFVSHRTADTLQALKLADALRDRGHNVWLDEWEVAIGDSIVEKMQYGLEGATHLVLCYSSSDVLSPWTSREWMSALARQLNGADVKILPVLLTGGAPPAILADIKYADLVSDWASGIDALCVAMS